MYESYQDKPKRESRANLRPILFVILAIAIVAFAAFTIRHFTGQAEEPPPSTLETPPASGGIIYDDSAIEGGWTQLSPEEIEESLNNKVSKGLITISMNVSPVFADGEAEGSLMIVNELSNNYPQQVEIVRNDTGETIYESNAIPVGSKIEKAALSADLNAGSYDCTAYFHSLDPETGTVIGTAGVVVIITIQN